MFMRMLMIISLLVSFKAISCEMADQYRLFPIGTSEGKILCFELDQFRDSKGLPGPIYWRVYARMISIDVDGKVTELETFPKFEVMDSTYSKILTEKYNLYRKSYLEKTQYTGILANQVEFGPFENSCGQFQYEFDTTDHNGYLISNSQKYEVKFPAKYLEHSNVFPEFYEEEVTDSLIESLCKECYAGYGIGSYRIFKNETMSFAVVSLGTGNHQFGVKNALHEKGFVGAAMHIIYNEPVLHHGHSFDVVVRL